jgi:hypothetical protein
MIGQCYKDEDEQNQEELVRGLSRDYMLWSKQADRHNRFAMVSNFPKA